MNPTPNPSRSVSPEPTKGERIEQIRERLRLASPGPWQECGHDRGGCQCATVWCLPADHPVAVVERAEWADEYPVIKTRTDQGDAGTVPQAVMEKAVYGYIDVEVAAANARLIAHAPTDIMFLLDQLAAYIPLVEAARVMLDECSVDWTGPLNALDNLRAAYDAALVQVPGQQQADTEQGGV